MQTDYSRIKEEHIKGYGDWVDDYGPKLLSDRYSDRTHFIYELLQNAEDAIGWRLAREASFPRDVSFELKPRELVFRHHGLPFTEEHVRGICKIGSGTKGNDLTSIGKHGIGFKSVYAYTRHPEVHSGEEHFVIDSFVRPSSVQPKPTRDGETKFFFPFDYPEVPAATAYDEIANRLRALGLRTLLFLRNIESIAWELDAGTQGQYLREAKPVMEGVERVTLLGRGADGKEVEEEWLLFSEPVKNKGQAAGAVEIAFSLKPGRKSGTVEINAVSESPLVVFFPTEKETHFGFLLQGPYRTTPSRDNIPREDSWNRQLILKTSELLVRSLAHLRELGLLTVSALDALVVAPSKYDSDAQLAMFQPIGSAIIQALTREGLIPRFGGGYVAGANARLARAEALRALVSSTQLGELAGSIVETAWVTGDITRDRTPALRSFLVESIGVKEIDGEDFVRDVSAEFLRKQSDNWIANLYAFLLEQPAIQKRPWFGQKPIVRLKNGAHVSAFGFDGAPNAYLPGRDQTEFPTISPAVCHGDALKFLRGLGLKEPDPVDDVIHHILPRYQDQSSQFPPQYDDDVRRIVEAFQTDSKTRQGELVKRLREASWIPCRNAQTGAVDLAIADCNTYLPTQKMLDLFTGNSAIWFADRSKECLHSKKSQEVLEACGVAEYLQRYEIDCTLSYEERLQIRRAAGLERSKDESVDDYAIAGLDELLERIASAGKECERNAFALWDCLNGAIRHHREGFLYGDYSWSYSFESKRVRFPADFVRRLQARRWLPGPDGEPRRPSEVYFAQLPEKFRDQANPELVKVLEFKPDEVKQLAQIVGIDEEVLDIIRQHGWSADELRKRFGLDEEKIESPDDSTGYSNGDVENTTDAFPDGTEGPTPPISEPTGAETLSASDDGDGSGYGNGADLGGTGTTIGGGPHEGGTTSPGGTRSSDSRGAPTRPGGGKKPSAGGAKQFISYVATHPDEEDPDPDGLDQNSRRSLEEQAISLILECEPALRRTPANNPGFDLYETNVSGQIVRWVEVKAMTHDLHYRPVGLSRQQFECAQEHGSSYWLYVVEHADDKETATIIRIQDPHGKARTFTFDHGWLGIAEVEQVAVVVRGSAAPP